MSTADYTCQHRGAWKKAQGLRGAPSAARSQQTFILRERGGRCELLPDIGMTASQADQMVSRANFKDDDWDYCAFTGIFASQPEARRYAQLRSQGLNCEAAFKLIREARSNNSAD